MVSLATVIQRGIALNPNKPIVIGTWTMFLQDQPPACGPQSGLLRLPVQQTDQQTQPGSLPDLITCTELHTEHLDSEFWRVLILSNAFWVYMLL